MPNKKTNPFYSINETERRSGKSGVNEDREQGRTAYQKDYARLLHAPSFRRLQNKTQLFPGSESDFFRNRLTHSLEVAQIAGGIASSLNNISVKKIHPNAHIDECLVEFAGIAHDLGHPPFGHNGEHALNDLMREHGGFEGNAQTLRILTTVERKSIDVRGMTTDDFGLDLTYRTLASILKYDREIKYESQVPADTLLKGYYSGDAAAVGQIKNRVAPKLKDGEKFKTVECAIMDMADDIAYSTYDLEDTLHAGFVSPMMLAWAVVSDQGVAINVTKKTNDALREAGHKEVSETADLLEVILDVFKTPLPTLLVAKLKEIETGSAKVEDILADRQFAMMINADVWNLDNSFKTDTRAQTRFTSDRVGRLIEAVEFVPNQKFPQLSSVTMNRKALLQVEVMKHLNFELVIRSPRLAMVENRGKEVVTRIYKTLLESKGSLLPPEWRKRHAAAEKDESLKRRVVCDFVACMTDRYAAELDARLFGEGSSIFQPL